VQKRDNYFNVGWGERKVDFHVAPVSTKAEVLGSFNRRLDAALRFVDASLNRQIDPSFMISDEALVSWRRLEKECLKYTSKAKAYGSKAEAKFTLDLRGWSYLKDWQARTLGPVKNTLDANRRIVKKVLEEARNLEIPESEISIATASYPLEGTTNWNGAWDPDSTIDWDVRIRKYGPETFRAFRITRDNQPGGLTTGSLKLSELESEDLPVWGLKHLENYAEALADPQALLRWKHLDQVKTILWFVRHIKRSGQWSDFKELIEVDAAQGFPHTVETFRVQLKNIEETLDHELRHVGQSALYWVKSIDQTMRGKGGMPSPSIRTTNPDQLPRDQYVKSRPEHALRDEEFHTRISDEIQSFLRELPRFPRNAWRYVLLKWVDDPKADRAISPDGHWDSPIRRPKFSTFFRSLKKNQPAKWQEAVRLFVSEIGKHVQIPPAIKLARLPTPESKTWERDEKARARHVAGAAKAFSALLDVLRPFAAQAIQAAPGDEATQGRQFIKLVKDNPTLRTYLDTWIGTEKQHPQAYSWRSAILYRARDHLIQPKKFPLAKTLVEVRKQAEKGFQAIVMAQSQAPLRKHLPEEIRAFLPKNIVVEVDRDGVIQRVTDRFENEHETLGVKIQVQHNLIHKYNDIVRQVKKDLTASDERIRMAALVTAIIMETGIRPGQEGNHVVKTQDGQEVEIETFGATTLGPNHIKFFRDNFGQLEFTGKKGTTNVAVLTNPQVLKILQTYVEQAKAGNSNLIFVGKDGVPFTYNDLAKYFKARFAGFSPTDFRKLKATETVLTNLRQSQVELYRRIQEFSQQQTKSLKSKVTAEVAAVIEQAYLDAQKTLSHESVEVTIRAYVNPEVVLRFLSQGRVEDTLQQAILSGRPRLMFDPNVFVQQALNYTPVRVATLQNILDDLESELSPSVDRVASVWMTRI